MKVFIPHKKDKNIYFDEIIQYSYFEYIFDDYHNYDAQCKIVNIQFPEAIFDWQLPSKDMLADLERELQIWKSNSRIVYTMNDFKPHYKNDSLYNKLFNLIYQYADGVIHLGNFSKEAYKDLFSKTCLHKVIYHPTYTSLLKNYTIKDIQELTSFDLKDKYIVSSIGSIRSKEEMKMIFNFFKKIPKENKVLIVPRILFYKNVPNWLPYRFKKPFAKIIAYYNLFAIKKELYYIDDKFLEYPYLVDLIKKSSLIIIPRVKNLNSGNLFLGLTFNKNMVVPNVGNIKEILSIFKIPFFNFNKINNANVADFIQTLETTNYFEVENYETIKEEFHPMKIAKSYDDFFLKFIP